MLGALRPILDDTYSFILPPEVIEEHGDVNDWRNVVGTGPYMLIDLVEGSSIQLGPRILTTGLRRKIPGEPLALY